MKCFYHNDADGRCAGFWVKHSAPNRDSYPVEFIEISYGTPFPFYAIRPQEQIYIVDYSISPEEMLRLLEITTDVTWIDHHKTAIEKYADFPHYICGVRKDGIAACMLTYLYFKDIIIIQDPSIRDSRIDAAPLFTRLIADCDVWKFDYGDDARRFVTAINAYDMHPQSDTWNVLLNASAFTSTLISEGRTMMKYRDGWSKDYCKDKGFEALVDGIPAFAMNLGNCNSDFFKSVSDGYDILVPFSFNGDVWTVSLYSKIVDVGSIAKRCGGGGHRGAAGFTSKKFPFIKVSNDKKELNPYEWRLRIK